MGYELIDTETLTLPDFPDLRVTVRLASTFREFKQLEQLSLLQTNDPGALDDGLAAFGDGYIESWNVTTRGEPLEPNGENFNRLPPLMKIAILQGWVLAVRLPSAPLGQGSSDGQQSPEPSTTKPENE